MTSPHDRPTASELLESIKEWLDRDVLPAVEGRLVFHTRVAINSLDIVMRELATSDEMSTQHEHALATLGVSSDRELSQKIQRGDCDDDLLQLLKVLEPVIESKVSVSNPKYLLTE